MAENKYSRRGARNIIRFKPTLTIQWPEPKEIFFYVKIFRSIY